MTEFARLVSIFSCRFGRQSVGDVSLNDCNIDSAYTEPNSSVLASFAFDNSNLNRVNNFSYSNKVNHPCSPPAGISAGENGKCIIGRRDVSGIGPAKYFMEAENLDNESSLNLSDKVR